MVCPSLLQSYRFLVGCAPLKQIGGLTLDSRDYSLQQFLPFGQIVYAVVEPSSVALVSVLSFCLRRLIFWVHCKPVLYDLATHTGNKSLKAFRTGS